MIDITTIPACILSSPFPVVALDVVVQHDFEALPLVLLLVGRDRACFVSLSGENISVRRFVFQYHRILTTGAFCMEGTNGECVCVLADEFSSLTVHRITALLSDRTHHDHHCGTIFVGDAWDATRRVDQVLSLRGNCQADAVCTRRGEKGVVWSVVYERETAGMIKVDGSLGRLFPLHDVAGGCFAAAVRDGVSFFSADTGETRVHLALPRAAGSVGALHAGESGSYLYVAVSSCGTAFLYDQRRAVEPVWSRQLWTANNSANDIHMTYCHEGVWAVCTNEQLYYLRCITNSVVCRSFFLPECFLFPQLVTAGICFTDGTLCFVGHKGA